MKQHLWRAPDNIIGDCDLGGGKGQARRPWSPAWSDTEGDPGGEARVVSWGDRGQSSRSWGVWRLQSRDPGRREMQEWSLATVMGQQRVKREPSARVLETQGWGARVLAAHSGAQLRPQKGPPEGEVWTTLRPLLKKLKNRPQKDHTKHKYPNPVRIKPSSH